MDAREEDDPDEVGRMGFNEEEILAYLASLARGSFDDLAIINQSVLDEFRNSNILREVVRECGFQVDQEPDRNELRPRRVSSSNIDEPELTHAAVTSPTVTSSGIVENPEEGSVTSSESEDSPMQYLPKKSPPTTQSKKTDEKNNLSSNSPKQISSSQYEFTENSLPVVQSKQKDNLTIKPISAPQVSSSSSTTGKRGENFRKKQDQRLVKRNAPCPKSKKKLFCQRQQFQEPEQQLSADTSHGNQRQAPSVLSSTQQSSNDTGSQKNGAVGKDFYEVIPTKANLRVQLMDLKRLAKFFSDGLSGNTSIQVTPRLLEEIRQCEMKLGSWRVMKVSPPEGNGKKRKSTTPTSTPSTQSNQQVWPTCEEKGTNNELSSATKKLTTENNIVKEDDVIAVTIQCPVEENVLRTASASQDAPLTNSLAKEIARSTSPLPCQEAQSLAPPAPLPVPPSYSENTKQPAESSLKPEKPEPLSHATAESKKPESLPNATTVSNKLESPSHTTKESREPDNPLPDSAEMEPKRSELHEPSCADDGKELGGGETFDQAAANEIVVIDGEAVNIDSQDEPENNTESIEQTTFQKIKQQMLDDTVKIDEIANDPEVPLSVVNFNTAFFAVVLYILEDNPNPPLPDFEKEKDLAEFLVKKVAWWISKDDWYNYEESLDSASLSDSSFNDLLEFTQSEDDEVYQSLTKDMQTKKHCGPVDELCGRQLLAAQYRSGPADTFSNIFRVPGYAHAPLEAYAEEKFEALCTLCSRSICGKDSLASHVLSDLHRINMSKAGLDNVGTAKKDAEKGKEKADEDKSESSEKNADKGKSATAESKTLEKKDRKKNDDSKEKSKKKDEEKDKKEKKHKKRKRSNDRSSAERLRDESSAEIGVTSTGLPIKIPAGAIPDKSKKRSGSKDKHSRSRSPRAKRNRSRSPRHHRDRSPRRRSKSRSPRSSRRRRSRSRSRERARDRTVREPVVKISRSPGKSRPRSTSAEQAEKFLAKIKQRSRSPSNGHRKRPSPPPAATVLKKKTNKEFREKLALTADGKWTAELEQKWKLMEVQEAMFMERFAEKSNALKTTPENHPNYSEEWTAFWERRYHEVEEEGKDPDKYDYVPEWKEFWTKRLSDLLEQEYEQEIMKIKVQNGVDIETLQKLANTPVKPVMPVLQSESFQLQPQLQIPQPVPPPVHFPIGVPPLHLAQIHIPQMQVPSNAPSSILSEMGGEDMTSRPMSISDGADEHPGSHNNVPPAVPSPVVTTGDIMSTWAKLTSGGIPAAKQGGTGVPAPRAQQPLLSLSRKSSDDKSTSDSVATIDSFNFSTEIDVTLVLFKMSQLEDQLSFFADKVKEYFQKAEKMDLQKRNKSYKLLTDDDFVAMLYQIRDRFMAMIRARILPKDVIDKLNHAVYGLDGLMEHPECIKRRPKPPRPPEVPPPQQQEARTVRPSNVNDTFTRPSAPSAQPRNPLRYLPDGKRKEIASLVTNFLNFMGRPDLTDNELKELLRRMCQRQPITSTTAQTPSFSGTIRNTTSSAPAQGGGRDFNKQQHNSNRESDTNSRSSVRFGENTDSDPWRLPERNMTKVHSVASFQIPGAAQPQLPNAIIPQFLNPTGGSGPIRFGRGSGGSEGGASDWGRGPGGDNYSSSSSGRHSPFSRRDFSGNPVPSSSNSANPYRDKANTVDVSSTFALPNQERPFGARASREDQKNHLVNRTLQEVQRDPETKMAQLSRCNDIAGTDPGGGAASVEEELAFHILTHGEIEQVEGIATRRASIEEITREDPNLSTLPPGIMNMIIQERNTKLRQQEEESITVENVLSDEPGESCNYYRRGKRKRKKKKAKKGRLREYRSNSRSSGEDTDGSKHARDRSKERRRRRENKTKRNDRENSSGSSPLASDRPERESRGRAPPPQYNRRESMQRMRSNKRQSRSASYERNRRRRGRGRQESDSSSRGDRRRVRKHKSRDQSLPLDSKSKWQNPSLSPTKSDISSVVELVEVDRVTVRRAPPRDNRYNQCNREGESCSIPLQEQSSKSFLKENNLRAVTAQKTADKMEMFAPSPPASSVNSESSGYRRTKERPRRTTINVPNRNKLKPREDTWEILSEVSSLGEDWKRHQNETSVKCSQDNSNTGEGKVTSVSKTFWTEKDEDVKSLSSVSSHNLTFPDKKSQQQIGGMSSTASKIAGSSSERISRNYRVTLDEDRESGEVSSSSGESRCRQTVIKE